MTARDDRALLKAMPAVFVLIWSTGFIVARYGMPHAPPMKFLVVRYALSILCFLPIAIISGCPNPPGYRFIKICSARLSFLRFIDGPCDFGMIQIACSYYSVG